MRAATQAQAAMRAAASALANCGHRLKRLAGALKKSRACLII
jgi:hypothetical protein